MLFCRLGLQETNSMDLVNSTVTQNAETSAVASTTLGTAPLLSVCIATYKRGEYIGRTLESILTTFPAEVEIVVVDGASPDHTCDVVAPIAAMHPRLRYFREESNSG